MGTSDSIEAVLVLVFWAFPMFAHLTILGALDSTQCSLHRGGSERGRKRLRPGHAAMPSRIHSTIASLTRTTSSRG